MITLKKDLLLFLPHLVGTGVPDCPKKQSNDQSMIRK